MDYYGFYTGKVFDAYRYLGAHVEREGVTFRTFAPSAQRISLIGEFSSWEECPMHKVYDGNFWECYIPGCQTWHDVQVPHLPAVRILYRPLRPLRIWHGAASQECFYYPGPLYLPF